MRKLNHNALEMVFQTGDEMLGSIFGGGEQVYKPGFTFNGTYESVDLNVLAKTFEGAIQREIGPHIDKRIGILLSGGLDSTLTLYLVRKLFPDADVTAYNTYFEGDIHSDERYFAKMAADFTDTELKIITLTAKKEIALLPEMVECCDSVRDGAIWAYAMSKAMGEDGMDILVNSMGSDSLLGDCQVHHRWYDMRRIRLFPMVNTKYKYLRYASILFGNDRAFFINSIAINAGKKYVRESTLDWKEWYDGFYQDNLWTTMTKWQMEIVVTNKVVMFDPMTAKFGMESVFPYLDEEMITHCLQLEPREVYNKIPMRDMMSGIYGIPMAICKRGLDWVIGPGEKMGGAPKPSYYAKEPSYYQHLLYGVEGKNFSLPIEQWIIKGHVDWIESGNRRARHLGYLVWQLKNDLEENR